MATLTRISLAIAASLLLAQAAFAAPRNDKDNEKPQPSFKPGASVTLLLELKAPDGWHLNYMAPVAISFDKEQLKGAPYSVERTEFIYKFDDYRKSFTAEVPIKLKDGLKEGPIEVQFQLDLSMCEKVTDICTFLSDDKAVPVQIKLKSGKDEDNQALVKGDLPVPIHLQAM